MTKWKTEITEQKESYKKKILTVEIAHKLSLIWSFLSEWMLGQSLVDSVLSKQEILLAITSR